MRLLVCAAFAAACGIAVDQALNGAGLWLWSIALIAFGLLVMVADPGIVNVRKYLRR